MTPAKRLAFISANMDTAVMLDPKDLALLLRLEPGALMGRIMLLNKEPRYHNRLDAIQLVARILELRTALDKDEDRKR